MTRAAAISVLALIGAASGASTLSKVMGKRDLVVSLNCVAQLTACQNDKVTNCYDKCWTPMYTDNPAPTTKDCGDFVDWFTHMTVPDGCTLDYQADTANANPLSMLSYCYYDDITKNDNKITCPIVIDACQTQIDACYGDDTCKSCMKGQADVKDPAAGATCTDFQAWYLESVDSYPASCDVKGALISDYIYCHFDSTVFLAGVTDCPAVPGFQPNVPVVTDAPTIAPTMAPTMAPTLAPTVAPTMAPTVATMAPVKARRS